MARTVGGGRAQTERKGQRSALSLASCLLEGCASSGVLALPQNPSAVHSLSADPSRVALTGSGPGAVCPSCWPAVSPPTKPQGHGESWRGIPRGHAGREPSPWVHALGSAGWACCTLLHCPEQPPLGILHTWASSTAQGGSLPPKQPWHHPSPMLLHHPASSPQFGGAAGSSNVADYGSVWAKSAPPAPRSVPRVRSAHKGCVE